MQLEELGEHSSPREYTVEEAFLSLHGLPPFLAEDIHVLYKESLTDALLKLFGQNGAIALMRMVGDDGFDDPEKTLANLDPIFGAIGSTIVKNVVAKEFTRNVRQLIMKAEKDRK